MRLHDLDGFRRVRQLDVLPAGVLDRDDRRLFDANAAVAKRPVRTDEVDRTSLGDTERDGGARVLRLGLEGHPEVLRPCEEVIRAVDDGRFDRRDVQRELQRIPDPDRTSLEVVGVGRRVATAEVGGAVHEHVARGDRLVIDGDDVVERLERRARLAVALGHHVELGLEPLVLRCAVVVGGADLREDLAGLVVLCDERAVANVLVLEVLDPRRV